MVHTSHKSRKWRGPTVGDVGLAPRWPLLRHPDFALSEGNELEQCLVRTNSVVREKARAETPRFRLRFEASRLVVEKGLRGLDIPF